MLEGEKRKCAWCGQEGIARDMNPVYGHRYTHVRCHLNFISRMYRPNDPPAQDGLVKAVAGFERCHGGQGANCCAYLMVGGDGFECGRDHYWFKAEVEKRVRGGLFTARRLPKLDWPDCHDEGIET